MCKKFPVLTKSCRSRTDGPALVSNTDSNSFIFIICPLSFTHQCHTTRIHACQQTGQNADGHATGLLDPVWSYFRFTLTHEESANHLWVDSRWLLPPEEECWMSPCVLRFNPDTRDSCINIDRISIRYEGVWLMSNNSRGLDLVTKQFPC